MSDCEHDFRKVTTWYGKEVNFMICRECGLKPSELETERDLINKMAFALGIISIGLDEACANELEPSEVLDKLNDLNMRTQDMVRHLIYKRPYDE